MEVKSSHTHYNAINNKKNLPEVDFRGFWIFYSMKIFLSIIIPKSAYFEFFSRFTIYSAKSTGILVIVIVALDCLYMTNCLPILL